MGLIKRGRKCKSFKMEYLALGMECFIGANIQNQSKLLNYKKFLYYWFILISGIINITCLKAIEFSINLLQIIFDYDEQEQEFSLSLIFYQNKIECLLMKVFWDRIFSCAWPFYEQAVSDLDRSMHRSLWVQFAQS
jgi:hypothetical protein